ncbi:UNVERIFIED_CONTAM: hypothetical protein FKN15_034508 [Acipenser sinensis]
MEKTLKDHLVDTLDELVEEQFNWFKDKLGETRFQERKIAKGKLEKAKRLEVASLLISTYSKKHAAENTILILRAINETELAEELEKKTRVAGVPGEVEEVIEGPVSLLRTHKVQLIEVLSNDPSPVVQGAHSKGLLSDRKYRNIRSTHDPNEKIAELLDFIMGKGSGVAQQFIELLKTLKNDFPALPAELLENCIVYFVDLVGSGEWRVEGGEWGVESGEWRVGSGEWGVESGEWGVESGEWRVEGGGWRVETGDWRVYAELT